MLAGKMSRFGDQRATAAELGISQGYLSRVVRGERVPGLSVRRKLARYGITLEMWDLPK